MSRTFVITAFSVGLIGLLLSAATARADAGNQEIVFTVTKAPIEIPGFALAPGTYDMRFSDSEHQTVEIATDDGRYFGFFNVARVRRDARKYDVKMVFSKAAGGAPSRLEEFFYPGSRTGYRFVYANSVAARRTGSLTLGRK